MGDEKPKTRSDELGDGVRVREGEGVEALSVRVGVLINSNTTEVVVGKKVSEGTTVVGIGVLINSNTTEVVVGIGVLINSNTTEVAVGKKASEDTTVVGKTVVWTIDDVSTVVDGGTISVVSSGKMVDMEGSGVGVRKVLRVSEGDRGIRNSELSEILKINVV